MPEPGLIYTKRVKLNQRGASLEMLMPQEWVKAHDLQAGDEVQVTVAKRLIIEAIDPPNEADV